ncbi:MAG TPA: ankyrin repeat domain-containing protein [Thermoanaerobaculia bacterium]
MNTQLYDLMVAFEIHSVDRIRSILDAGFDVRAPVQGKTPLTHLLEMYFRSASFVDCVRLMLDRGALLEDPALRPVLLNDPDELDAAVRSQPDLLKHRTSMSCAFTPLVGATLLHVAAEYGHLEVARRLIELGAEVDARAATDDYGFNGHTALFHRP